MSSDPAARWELLPVGYLDQNPVAMGGWRLREPTTFAVSPAELKRMYVVPAARRRGG